MNDCTNELLPRGSKDPDDVLDYVVDFSEWLAGGDTITAVATEVEHGGVTVDSSPHTADAVTVWLSGGDAGKVARVGVRVTTAAGRTKDITLVLDIEHH